MRKINSLFGQNAQLSVLAEQIHEKELINKLWHSATPIELSKTSYAALLEDGQLIVYASNSATASKIKLSQASLLKALNNSIESYAQYSQCKVTAIKVKVQVKSTPAPSQRRTINLSSTGAQHLKHLADQLGESKLGNILNRLASKHLEK
jgi:hypothetical protein